MAEPVPGHICLAYDPFGWSQGARKVYPFGHRVVRQSEDEAPSARSSLACMTEVLIKDGRALKHVQVREYVRSLVSGMSPGSPAPSERELVAQFGVARMTVRQAMDALVVEGLLERIPGKGTFVARPRRTASTITSYSEEIARRGMLAESVTLLARREQAGPGVARALNITEGDPVIHWKRLRRADGSPMCIEDAFLNEVLLPGFLQSGMPTSLYDALDAARPAPDLGRGLHQRRRLPGRRGHPPRGRRRRPGAAALASRAERREGRRGLAERLPRRQVHPLGADRPGLLVTRCPSVWPVLRSSDGRCRHD